MRPKKLEILPKPPVLPKPTANGAFCTYVESSNQRAKRLNGLVALSIGALAAVGAFVLCMFHGVMVSVAAGLGFVVLYPFLALPITVRAALTGNEALEADLRSRLPEVEKTATFVGLGELRSNTPRHVLFQKGETDENVGLLSIRADHISISMEEGNLKIPAGAIQKITIVKHPVYRFLHWIRIDYEEDGASKAFLLMPRTVPSLWQESTKAAALHGRLVSWHAEAQLSWLEQNR